MIRQVKLGLMIISTFILISLSSCFLGIEKDPSTRFHLAIVEVTACPESAKNSLIRNSIYYRYEITEGIYEGNTKTEKLNKDDYLDDEIIFIEEEMRLLIPILVSGDRDFVWFSFDIDSWSSSVSEYDPIEVTEESPLPFENPYSMEPVCYFTVDWSELDN